MRVMMAALLVAVPSSLAPVARAQQTPDAAPDELSKLKPTKPMTARFHNAEPLDVLRFLGPRVGIEIRVAPGFKPTTPITLDVRDTAVVEVFRAVGKKANLKYTAIDEKTLLIEAGPR